MFRTNRKNSQNKAARLSPSPASPLEEPGLPGALDTAGGEHLRTVAIALGLLYVIFPVIYLLILPKEIAPLLAVTAELTALVLLFLYLFLGRRSLPLRWSNLAGSLVSALILANSLLHIYLTGDLLQTIALVLLILGAGYLFQSHNWLTIVILVSISSWVIVVWSLAPPPSWINYAALLLTSAVMSTLMHAARLQTLRRLEGMRKQDARRKTELEAVLVSTEEAQRSLATSMAIGQRITSILDLDVLLNQVADIIKERYRASYVGIFLLDDNKEYAIARAGTGEAGRALTKEAFRLRVGQENLIGWVAKKRRPARVDDVSQDPRCLHFEAAPGTRSELAIPLEMSRNLLGVLDLHSDREAGFQEDDVPFLQMLADQIAIAIQNASLFEAEKSRRLLAETLYSIARALSSTLNLQEVLELILKRLEEVVYYDRGAVMLRKGEELELAAARGYPTSSQKLYYKIQEEGVFEEIYQTGQLLHLPDVSLRSDWQHTENLPTIRTWLGIPLIHTEEVIGMLSLSREHAEPFNNDEITFSSTFAGQAAIALHNARLYERITLFNQELEARVEQRTQALQTAYDQLERLDRTKSDFISVASHELRTPITVLQGYCQMLRDDPVVQQSSLRQQLVSGIQAGALRLNEIVSSLLDTAKIDSRALELHPNPVYLTTLIDFVCSGLDASLKERKHTLVIEKLVALPAIKADPDAIKKVFYHLLVNAIKYTPDGGTITISGRCLTNPDSGQPDAVEVIVRDTGIGIDQGLQELIFAKFYQTGEVAFHSSGKVKFKGGGPGLGLAIARGIVEAHGGRIWVESPGHDEATCPGSHFHVVLPVHH